MWVYRREHSAEKGALIGGRIAIGVCLIVLLSAAACSNSNDNAAPNPPSTVPATTTTTLSCATIQHLVNARQLRAARNAVSANPACDSAGLRDRLDRDQGRVAGLLADAQAAIGRKNESEARTLLLTALAVDAGNDELARLLAQLDTPISTTTTVDPFIAAKRLHDAGYRKEAEALVAEALKTGKTLPESGADELDKHRSALEFISDNWFRIVLGLLLFAAAVYEVLRRRTLSSAKKWPWTRKPYIVSAPIAGDDNVALAALTRHQLRRIGEKVNDVRLAIAPIPEPPVDLPDLSDFDAKLKPLMTLWRWISRRDILTASELFPAADKTTNNRLLALEFFDRRSTYSTEWRVVGVADASLQLRLAAAYAAGWIAVRAPALRPHLGSSERTTRLGTTSASSFAAFSAGIEAWDAGSVTLATQLFRQAAAEDKTHLRAVHNHSVAMIGTGLPISVAAGSLELLRLLAPPSTFQ